MTSAQLQAHELELPICVDLDQTLVRTDTLIEGLAMMCRSKPWLIFALPFWMMKGRAQFKAILAHYIKLDPSSLPYNKDVFFFLKRMVNRGRQIVLVTGANEEVARSVADYLGVFSEVIASTDHVNNVGHVKAQKLTRIFGEKEFLYIGDSEADLPVWKSARAGMIVSSSLSLIGKSKEVTQIERIFSAPRTSLKTLLRTIRVHQWVKNLLLFLPVILAFKAGDTTLLLQSLIGFFSFSFMASAIYIVNDVVDLSSDRQHIDKKSRPFASGEMPLAAAFLLFPSLFVGSLICASVLPPAFWTVLAIYVVTTNFYTFSLKRIAIVDVLVLTSLYSLRLIAGASITGIQLSPWLIAFSGFFFLSLAMIKRCAELKLVKNLGKVNALGRGYHVDDLNILQSLGGAAGYGAVVVFTLYVNSDIAKSLYTNVHLLWIECPIMIFWFSRMWFLTNRGMIHSDPVKFAIKDPVSLGIALGTGIVWFFAKGLY